MIHLLDDARVKTRSCDAMNTTFTLRLDCADTPRAEDAAGACFNQLETLENELSRFRHDSDVSRINALQAGESLYLSETSHACLLQAFEVQAMTGGLFDVTVGARTWPDRREAAKAGPGQLQLAPDQPLITCLSPGREIDLGGIGKGFALDQLALTLASFQIESALLAAGASTLLAIGPETWPIALTGDAATEEIGLQGRALSASGTGIQGAHVVRPGDPEAEPAYQYKRVWLTAPGAAVADACSTACLLMTAEEIESFARVHHDELNLYVEVFKASEIQRINPPKPE